MALNQNGDVKIIDGSLHDSPLRGGTVTLRGIISWDTLKNLLFDTYQRERPSLVTLKEVMDAIKKGEPISDIEIGMRGSRVKDADGANILLDECYVIDGQRRVNACLTFLVQNPGLENMVQLGATIHFDTDRPWERSRFRILNTRPIKVSPNIILRNEHEDHPGLGVLYKLTAHSGDFCLSGRVSWNQNMKRGAVTTALTLCKITGRLHQHIRPGHATGVDDLARQLDALVEKVTPSQVRDNIKTFFNVVDEVWGIRTVHYTKMAPHLKGNFLITLARFFSNHQDFWRSFDKKLFVDIDLRRKLQGFKINDPNVINLTGAGGASSNILYGLIVDHMNSGKRTKRLRPRANQDDKALSKENDEDGDYGFGNT